VTLVARPVVSRAAWPALTPSRAPGLPVSECGQGGGVPVPQRPRTVLGLSQWAGRPAVIRDSSLLACTQSLLTRCLARTRQSGPSLVVARHILSDFSSVTSQ
jgi:hypothetical protein